eukprot:5494662-Prymnesium_polylepis.1
MQPRTHPKLHASGRAVAAHTPRSARQSRNANGETASPPPRPWHVNPKGRRALRRGQRRCAAR